MSSFFHSRSVRVLAVIILVPSLLYGLWMAYDYARWWLKMDTYRSASVDAWDSATRMEQARKDHEALYQKDTMGSTTPEGTWSLFLDALTRGDTDTAALYFIPEKQEEMKKNIRGVKDDGHIKEMVTDLTSNYVPYPSGGSDSYDFLYVKKINGKAAGEASLVRNTYTGVWKLTRLF